MLAVAGRTTPLKSPLSAIAITIMAAHGATPRAATATATSPAATAAVRT